MRKYFLLALGCCASALSQSQDLSLVSLTGIAPELKKDADVVYRLDEGILTVSSPSEYSLSVHQTVTLLNAEAAGYLRHRFGTDKFYKIDDIDIRVYNSLGLLHKAYGKKEFETAAAYDGFSLVTDDKTMSLYTPAPSYPCTLDLRYTIRASGYIELPNWYINYNRASTELFRYVVNVPPSLDIRYRSLNFSATPQIEESSKLKKYIWEVKNIAAKTLEGESFESARYLPQIEVAPNEFSYDGYKGSFRTWQDFGAWTYELYEEKKPFSDQRIAEIKNLLAGVTSRDEKIRILYRYLQQNMRYVSIQLGIGGFKPFAVKFVDEKKYGDCKALSNYMRYLLAVADIKAYPALINAGNEKIPADPQFPSDPFNHVILCIPGTKDSTWLECTSTTNEAGNLGTFTENKKALLLTENGGILVNTPKSQYNKNQLFTHNEVTIDADGGAVIQNRILASGEAGSFYKYVAQLTSDEQKQTLVSTLHYKDPDALTLTAEEKAEAVFSVQRSYDKLYDFKTGNKYFFPVCVNQLAISLPKREKRQSDYLFPYPYQKTDTTFVQVPAGFLPEAIPANKELKTPYTAYHRTITYHKEKNQLEVVSSLSLFRHVIPPADYPAVVEFYAAVSAAESDNLVLLKQ